MSLRICLCAKALDYAQGGHLWAYLNWALGLRSLGCDVTWLEAVPQRWSANELATHLRTLKTCLDPFGLAEHVALCSGTGDIVPQNAAMEFMSLDAAAEADLLLNFRYALPADVVGRFRRAALVDIDPGLLQIWLSTRQIKMALHDVYFTIGENVGQAGARVPDAGLSWQHTPPCADLDLWSVHAATADGAFTTVSHWWAEEWVKDGTQAYRNDKRTSFLPFLQLPSRTNQPVELCLCGAYRDDDEWRTMRQQGWRVCDAHVVASTPWDYQRYIQSSLGEFSCAKPSYVRLQNAWVSDRTVCYLASGKPAVVQDTGPSRFLPHAAGLFRFRTIEEAARCVESAAADYEAHCRLARELAEEHFDARKVAGNVLEIALS